MDKIEAVGVFEDRERAQMAIEALSRAGFSEDKVGLISREDRSPDEPPQKHIDNPRSSGDLTAAGVGIGAATGAAAGLGTGLALASGLIPGIGPVVAGGTIALLMAGSGAAAGSVLGGVFGMGVPQDEVDQYQSELAAGRTLVTVNAGNRYGEALRVLAECGAMQRTIDVGPRS